MCVCVCVCGEGGEGGDVGVCAYMRWVQVWVGDYVCVWWVGVGVCGCVGVVGVCVWGVCV